MSKLATLRLDGDLEDGVQVVLTITSLPSLVGNTTPGSQTDNPIEISKKLPPNHLLVTAIDQWQFNYRSLSSVSTTGIQPNEITIDGVSVPRMHVNGMTIDGSITELLSECQKSHKELRSQFNDWLLSESFRPIRDKWQQQLMQDEVRVLIRTENQSLLKLPWYSWDLIEQNSRAEVALSTPDADPVSKMSMPTLCAPVKILAIMGNKIGINIGRDREILNSLPDIAITFLDEPQLKDISDKLWEQTWDILFFAGHSSTEDVQGRIYLNATDSLTIEDLQNALTKAIDNGLQLAACRRNTFNPN